MPIVSMNEILHDAKEGGYAVGCFNSIDLAMARGIIRAAEEEHSPVILCHAEVHFKYTPLSSVMPILLEEASKASTPVALLLDHGKDFNVIVQAMHLGMNSVMFDGSELGLEDNVAKTAEISKIGHALSVAVEGEIGRVVRPADAGAEGYDDASLVDDTSLYTDPDQAAYFEQKTGIDALACAFGTVHGMYRKDPKLDFIRLAAIAQKTGIPIVMHGGSGLSKELFHKAIENGVRKINYYTNLALYVGQQIKKKIAETDEPFYHNLFTWAEQAVYEETRRAIRMFSGK
jgi:fructose-bisphosphate aldolase class II